MNCLVTFSVRQARDATVGLAGEGHKRRYIERCSGGCVRRPAAGVQCRGVIRPNVNGAHVLISIHYRK
jgi:hypothetical protein